MHVHVHIGVHVRVHVHVGVHVRVHARAEMDGSRFVSVTFRAGRTQRRKQSMIAQHRSTSFRTD